MKPLETMFRPLILVAAVALAGCSAKPVSPDYFGSAERVQAALADPDIPILIGEFGTTEPNSAGGVDVEIEFFNSSEKTINYISFWLTPYNKVGDVVTDRLRRGSTRGIRFTGPIESGKSNTYIEFAKIPESNNVWKNIWYNNSIHCATIHKIKVEYNDGTSQESTNVTPLLTRLPECRWYRNYSRSGMNVSD